MLTVRRLSPAGVGALAVLKLRGAQLPAVLRDGRGAALDWPAPGRVKVAWLATAWEALDQVLVVGRDDGAELQLHGGPAVLEAGLELLRSQGAEVRGLAVARDVPTSLAAARARSSAQAGPLAALACRARAALMRKECPPGLRASLSEALALRPLAERLARPAVVRLVGQVNVGKSTLFNAIVGERRALVSPFPGTTRDSVRCLIRLRGIPVLLEDSAGSAHAPDPRGTDRLVRLLSPQSVPHQDEQGRVLEVLGKADTHSLPGAVSGFTGQGVDGLLARIADSLGLSDDPARHVLAPMSPALVRLLLQAVRLPG